MENNVKTVMDIAKINVLIVNVINMNNNKFKNNNQYKRKK